MPVVAWLRLNVWLVLALMPLFGAAQSAEGVRARRTDSAAAVLGSGPPELIVGITQDGLSSEVRRGESRRRHLRHSAVVRVNRASHRILGASDVAIAPAAPSE